VKYCSGNRTKTDRKLKKSWTIEAENERLNSTDLFMLARETRVLVTEVPILAPMMIGMAVGTVRAPPPTRPTTMDVVVEELWMTDVVKMPMNRPTKGLEVPLMRLSEKPLPNIFIDVPIMSILKRNR
jgi:hypothetical protein